MLWLVSKTERNVFCGRHREIFELIVLTAILLAFHLFVSSLSDFLQYTLDPSHKPDLPNHWSNQTAFFIEKTCYIVLFVVLLVSPYATFCCARNDQLVFPIRLLVTTENVCRFLFAFANFGIILCNADYKIFNAKCSSTISSFFDFLHANFQFLELCTQYCQVGVSINRFFAVSFDGLYFRYTLKWPFLQLLLVFLFGWLCSAAQYLPPVPEPQSEYVNVALINIEQSPFLWMCALDFLTNQKLKKLRENGKVSRAERLLMIQMLCNSGAQFLDTITWKFFLIFVTLFFGYNMQRLFVFSVYLMSFLLMDLGGCIVCILFLRKVSPTPSQSRRSTISNHHRPSL